jgi:hypothetical protein
MTNIMMYFIINSVQELLYMPSYLGALQGTEFTDVLNMNKIKLKPEQLHKIDLPHLNVSNILNLKTGTYPHWFEQRSV